MKKIILIVGSLLLAGLAYYLISPVFIHKTAEEDIFTPEEQMKLSELIQEPDNADLRDDALAVVKMGNFQPHDHDVAGSAAVIEREGVQILRFQDFQTINGPNLHIWLSKDLTGNEYIDLGPIKATQGNANYDLPDDVNLDEYPYVLVWCVPFKVLFSYAELQ